MSSRTARFAPHRTDDLRPGVMERVGEVTDWEWMGTMDEGPYEGQSMWVARDWTPYLGWVPDCDLRDADPETREHTA